MRSTSGLAAVLAAMVVPISASVIERLPEPTGAGALDLAVRDGVSPRPTAAPFAGEVFNFARADGLTAVVASDNTCGFVSALQGAYYTCIGSDYSCALIPGAGSSTGNVGCCNTKACTVRRGCVDYAAYYSSSACDDACRLDAFTVKCLNSATPYCNTISFSGGIVDYWCNNQEIASAQAAFTTYSGGPNRVYKTTVLFEESSSSSSESSSSSSSSSATSSSTSSSASSSSTSDSSNGGSSKSGGGAPIGAIVGGVVGGVAAIGIIGIIVWLILRKKRSNAEKPAAAAAAAPAGAYGGAPQYPPPGHDNGAYPPVSQVPPQGQPYNPNSGFYDPKFVAAGGQPNYAATGQYPQNGGYNPGYGHPPSSTSPTLSPGDPRSAVSGTSPSPSNFQQPGYGQPPPTIHEAPANPAQSHRGPMHELA
ncbi:unnamed protein product [Clonostachys byssicola]|uniref:Uncharacterized protein n=1 Tax=Clonostachys byssicola TaxID=160290 RepID=A0A9N9UYT9_9HYPO|nr:unnamed protein product [Clonostachys byssicola]